VTPLSTFPLFFSFTQEFCTGLNPDATQWEAFNYERRKHRTGCLCVYRVYCMTACLLGSGLYHSLQLAVLGRGCYPFNCPTLSRVRLIRILNWTDWQTGNGSRLLVVGGVARLRYQLGHWLSWLEEGGSVFLSPSRPVSGQDLQLEHDNSILHFQLNRYLAIWCFTVYMPIT
jgi:hypothetical protein